MSTANVKRIGGLEAMRALAHPTRVRMMHILHQEAVSASELARRLDIPYGTAHFHLRLLARAGIAVKASERQKRGGTEVLFTAPEDLQVEWDAAASPQLRTALYQAYATEVARRLALAAIRSDPSDSERDVLTLHDFELDVSDTAAARTAVHELANQLRRLESRAEGGEGQRRHFTLSVAFVQAGLLRGESS